MDDLFACTSKGCKRANDDPSVLLCAKRSCVAQLEDMMLESLWIDSEHDGAKKSQTKQNFDKESYVIDYFKRVEADILLEKEVNLQKLIGYYQTLEDVVRERKAECLQNLSTNKTLKSELDAFKQTLAEQKSKLSNHNRESILKTLELGDEAKWKGLQSEFNILCEEIKSLGENLKMKSLAGQTTEFIPCTINKQLESIYGRDSHSKPRLISANADVRYSVYCDSSYGQTFGDDILITDNKTHRSYTNLRSSLRTHQLD